MPELLIKYKDKRALNALIDFSKYFNFSILSSMPNNKEEAFSINGVAVLQGDSSIDTSDLEVIFSNRNINAKILREQAWQRKK
ncbi:MAG: hypothetical protein HY738_17240 [Bacteroidia bacterium]|nr:hypothetical protein [Bacteroidia bacterium]